MQQDWQQWKYINREKIQHIVGYEEKFVDEILSRIPEITPNDVIPQYHFTDSKNGNRYIDFMISNKSKGYSLPIELDGYAKINNKGYEKFNDFLERQNDLIQKFGIVLRYTNKKAFNEADVVIREIRQALKDQANQKNSEEIKRLQLNKLIQEYEAKIAEYESKQKVENKSPNQAESDTVANAKKVLESFKQNHETQLKHVQKELLEIKGQQSKELNLVKNQIQKQIYIGIGAVAILVVGAIYYLKSGHVNNAIAERQALVSAKPTIEPQAVEQELIQPQAMQKQVIAQQASEPQPVVPLSQMVQAPINERPAQHSPYIEAQQAQYFIGQTQTVCGTVAQYKKFSKGVYLNFDRPYPHATFTVVIWDNKSHISDQLSNIEQQNLCVQGTVEEYKGKPQIILNSLSQIS